MNDRTESNTDDHILLQQIRDGHEDAAKQLHGRYAHRLQRLTKRQTSADIAARIDAEDIVQSVFRTFFRRAADGQYELPQGDELWGLLLKIAMNKVQAVGNYHRYAKRSIGRTQPLTDKIASTLTTVDDLEAERSLHMTIEAVLETFHPTHRQIVQLRMSGLSHEAISLETKRSLRTVERVIQQFRDALRVEIDITPTSRKKNATNERHDELDEPLDGSG